MLERDGYVMFFSGILLFGFVFDGKISRVEGAIFLLLYIAYTFFLLESKPKLKGKYHFREFINYFYKFQYLITIKSKIIENFNNKKAISKKEKKGVKQLFKVGIAKDVVFLALSGFLVVAGANYLVENAVFFANFFKVPQTIIGILIAIGTTMPEMSVAITATRKGLGNIVIGNAIGSCITNIFLVLGVAALISPLSILNITKWYTAPFMLGTMFLLLIFVQSDWKISKIEGGIFLALYAVFMTMLFLGFV
jgi:cation:H+ antiporter